LLPPQLVLELAAVAQRALAAIPGQCDQEGEAGGRETGDQAGPGGASTVLRGCDEREDDRDGETDQQQDERPELGREARRLFDVSFVRLLDGERFYARRPPGPAPASGRDLAS
jgi:hypothetical protein